MSAFALLPRPAAAQSAQAGFYSGPAYSGGQRTNPNNNASNPPNPPVDDGPAGNNNSQWGGGTGTAYGYDTASQHAFSGSSSCYGDLTATFTWTPINNSTAPPPPVIVTETTSSGWSADEASGTGDYKNPYKCPTTPSSTGHGISEMGTHYSMKAGAASVSSTASLAASAGGTGSSSAPGVHSVSDFVVYGASVSPVYISIGGGTADGQGGWDILVGQKCGPFLYGIPAACTVSNYQWSVSGTTMQSWAVSPDSTHTTEVDGSGPLNIESPVWFWNDASQTTETITCTATVTPPVGQGDPFPITVSQTVGVYLPAWSGKSLGGQMTVDAKDPEAVNAGDFCLYASPAPTQPGGMTWEATLAPPQSFPVTFDKGNIYLVQVVTPSAGYIDSSNQQWEDIFQGQLGIDTRWPYGWATYEDDPNEPYYVSYDIPGLDLTALQAIYGYDTSSFEDYIMYQPPNSPEYIPLGNFKWNVNGNADIPSTNNWADFTNPAGYVAPGGVTKFTPDNTYPSWMQNSGNARIPWKKL